MEGIQTRLYWTIVTAVVGGLWIEALERSGLAHDHVLVDRRTLADLLKGLMVVGGSKKAKSQN